MRSACDQPALRPLREGSTLRTAILLFLGLFVMLWLAPAMGQETEDAAELARLASPAPGTAASLTPQADRPSGIDLISLIASGGILMWPIGLMSLLVVTLAVERLVSFRSSRMLPRDLVGRLGELAREGKGTLDVEGAIAACRQYRSAAASVVMAMLMRTGRPLGEIEQAAGEAAQREADLHSGPIRWLNFAAAATPLMGLFGTVWGMIVAFHNSTNLTAERSRSEQLSEGIYTALVTTLAGLAVAIPAAILAQYLENRLGKIFHRIESLTFSLAPGLEAYTGTHRLDMHAKLHRLEPPPPQPVPPPVATPRVVRMNES